MICKLESPNSQNTLSPFPSQELLISGNSTAWIPKRKSLPPQISYSMATEKPSSEWTTTKENWQQLTWKEKSVRKKNNLNKILVHFTDLNSPPVITTTDINMKKVVFSSDGSTMICSSSDSVIVIKTEDMTESHKFKADGFINQMGFTSSGKIAVVTNKNTLTFFTIEGEEEVQIKLKEEGLCVDVNQDESIAYVGGAVRIYNQTN